MIPELFSMSSLPKKGPSPEAKIEGGAPALEPLTQNQLKKLLDARIIFKVRHSTWVSNLVPVHKKSREICLCIDF